MVRKRKLKDLKPCPFCGARGQDTHWGGMATWGFWVECLGCGAQGPIRLNFDEAQEAWNARTSGKTCWS